MCRDKPQILHGSQASSQQPHFCFLSPVMPTKLPAVTTGVVWLAVAFSTILRLLVKTSMRNESSIAEVTARLLKGKSQNYLQRLSPMIWSSIGEGGGEEGRETDKERRQRERSYAHVKDATRSNEWTSRLWTGNMLQTRAKLSWTIFSPFENYVLSTPGSYLTPLWPSQLNNVFLADQ